MKNKKCNFTLFELLVVIAIIAILAAMLMPVLSKTRERGVRYDTAQLSRTSGRMDTRKEILPQGCIVLLLRLSGNGHVICC